MSDALTNSVEAQQAKKWRLRHSLVLGLSLGVLIVFANQINKWRSREHILGMRGLPSGLLLTDVEAFERFKRDFAFQYEGRPAFPIVDAVPSSLLQAEFPDHFFVQVFVEYKFFGITVARPYHHRGQIWAISRRGGLNFCFNRGIQNFHQVIALLGSVGKQIRSVEDAEVVRRIFVELRGAGSFADRVEGAHRQVSPSVWRIAGGRATSNNSPVLSILEIYLDDGGVVESGWLTFE